MNHAQDGTSLLRGRAGWRNALGPALAGIAAMLIWASMPTLIKYGTDDLDLFQFVVLRYGLPLVCVVPFLPAVLTKVRGTARGRWFALAITMQAHVVLQVYALQHSLPASWFGLAFALGVPLTVVALKATLDTARVVSLGSAFVGVLFFVRFQDLDTFPTLGVVLAVLGSMAAWIVLTVQMVHLQKRLGDGEILVVFILLMAPAVIAMAPAAAWRWPTLIGGTAIVALATGVALALVLFSYCLRRLRVFGVSVQYLETIFAALIGTVFRGEPWLTIPQILAVVLVVGGLGALNRLETAQSE